MFYCPNCNYNFVIVRDQNITAVSDTPNTVSSSDEPVNKEVPKSKRIQSKDNEKKSETLFRCPNCSFSQEITPGTLILSRVSTKMSSQFNDNFSYKDCIYDATLPRTRAYVCPNQNCESQKNHEKREAVFFKPSPQSYNLKYVCATCQEEW